MGAADHLKYHNSQVTKVMAGGFSAGVLGNLSYDDQVNVWALEVGQYLACYELLEHESEDDSSAVVLANREAVVENINERLQSHNISYRIPCLQTGGKIRLRKATQAVSDTLNHVRGLASPAHCAFVLIGEASCFLREGVSVVSDRDKEAVREVARGRLKEIQTRCPNITFA